MIPTNETWTEQINNCGRTYTDDPVVVNYKYICDGLLVSIIGCLGVMGNIISLLVLSKPKLKDCFHQLLFALACFDTVYIVIGGINYTFKAFDADSNAYTIAFPYIIYPITNIGLCGTIFMTMAISIERFLGICYPLHLPPHNRKSWFYILPVLVLSIVVNVPKFFEAEIDWLNNGKWNDTSIANNMSEDSYHSHQIEEWVPAYRATDLRKDSSYIKFYITYFRLFSTAIIPLIALVTINSRILCELKKLKSKMFGSQRKLWKELNMFLVLLCIVVTFICCNTPRVIVDIWEFSHVESIVHCNELLHQGETSHPFLPTKWIICLTHISHFTGILNSSLNFLIYCFVGHNFRKEFLHLLGLRPKQFEGSELRASLKTSETTT
eukprot:TRINITY_DN29289_c0_g1_i1.p1 TRINITY_DN29289_c0_g1~~TRINITY_DN29289_c0_g1_i1.p1  ORF type:complete len:381 (-),score=37.07 TRINITY_DN29289_c0_g1_i1:225-1367(-)